MIAKNELEDTLKVLRDICRISYELENFECSYTHKELGLKLKELARRLDEEGDLIEHDFSPDIYE